MPTVQEILKKYAQQARFDQWMVPGQNPPPGTQWPMATWATPTISPEAQQWADSLMRELGLQGQWVDYNAIAQQNSPMFQAPEGKQIPMYQVGSAMINPYRWLEFMKHGNLSGIETELGLMQQEQGYVPAAQPTPTMNMMANAQIGGPSPSTTSSGPTWRPIDQMPQNPPPVTSYEEVVPIFQQLFGNMTPEQKAQLRTLVEALLNYFRSMGL